jgi:hypothetical protein
MLAKRLARLVGVDAFRAVTGRNGARSVHHEYHKVDARVARERFPRCFDCVLARDEIET